MPKVYLFQCFSTFFHKLKEIGVFRPIFPDYVISQDLGHIYKFTSRVNAIVRLPHPRSEDSQGQEISLPPSADKQTCNQDKSAQTTIPPYQPQGQRGFKP